MTKKKSKKPAFTLEQRTKMLMTPCKTRSELKNWIKFHLDLDLPDCTVSRYADTNPFEIVWEVYEICVLRHNPENIQELLYVAGRGSGKCALRNTNILTSTGPKYIQDIQVGDIVYTGKSWKPVVQTFDEGILNGVTVHTKKGKKKGVFSLTGSYDRHRILAIDNDSGKIDWKFMRDLKSGDLVYKSAVEAYKDQVDTKSEDYEKGWLCGAISGDGCVSRKGSNRISVSGADFPQHRYMVDLIHKYWGISGKVRRVSNKAISIWYSSKEFKQWFQSLVEGELCYFKKLKTLSHTPNFLAGFISGMMDTDGSHDSITLANPALVDQIGQILAIFGVHSVINPSRRPDSTTKFVPGHIVKYAECKYKTPLHDYLMPQFSKRNKFLETKAKSNTQFRYPSILVTKFGEHIKEKYEIAGGYWRLNGSKKKTHSKIPYSKDLWGDGVKSNESFVYSYKVDSFIELARFLGEPEWEEQLTLYKNGFFEEVESISVKEDYFYDLEVEEEHAYWSNGFISHNTLGMAIAELLVVLHDKRDVVHVGASMAQAKRCFDYIKKFLNSSRIRPIVNPPKASMDERILQKDNMEKSLFSIGGEDVTFEILPCTLKACLVETSQVLRGNEYIKLKHVQKGDMIASPQGEIEVIDHKTKEEECLRIELDDGRIIEGTVNHEVWTDCGWVRLKDLSDEHDVL